MDEQETRNGRGGASPPPPSDADNRKTSVRVLIAEAGRYTVSDGETMFEHALKNTQSRRLRKVLGQP